MIVYIDSEGTPVQEFSAIYVNEDKCEIVDVFHHHVKYPFITHRDDDFYARRHVHGLNLKFLSKYGLVNEQTLLSEFHKWLQQHPYTTLYAHGPEKEQQLLSPLRVKNVHLSEWKVRCCHLSHELALFLKNNTIPICKVSCNAHTSFTGWKPKCVHAPTVTDCAKMKFGFHCSLYDCVECYLFHLCNK